MSPSRLLLLLSPKRREIVRPAMEHPRGYVLMSVRKLAKRLKTDPATMVRIVRAMRFSSYREFQHYLHELSIVMATSFETMQDAPARVATVQGLLRVSLNQDRSNLEGLARTIESRPINTLVRRIYGAKQILVVGGDLAASLALFLEHHLMMLGLPVTSAIYPAAVVHKARFLTKHDVVIAISFHRGLRMTVEGLRQAHDNGVYCVGITDSVVSPLQRFADECFLTSVEAPSFGASYVAPMAFMNMLLVACANHRRARTMRILKQVEDEQRYGFRWFEE